MFDSVQCIAMYTHTDCGFITTNKQNTPTVRLCPNLRVHSLCVLTVIVLHCSDYIVLHHCITLFSVIHCITLFCPLQ